MSVLKNLAPQDVFSYFADICSIPHGSGNTGAISDYLVDFAKSHGLRYRQEPCGNVIIFKEATPGVTSTDTVMLQGHMDMVAVKTPDCPLDLQKDGLISAISADGEWVYAKGTSLGGDDGIAVAYALAILADNTIRHPALEAVFTVDEEIGLLGAAALDASDLKSTILLNMDSEDDGVFLTGCAGGATVECLAPAPMEQKTGLAYEWSISDLAGGHSGVEAHLERANANLLFGRFLAQVGKEVEFSVGEFSGGEKDNAIANRCHAILLVDPNQQNALEQETKRFEEVLKSEYALVEPELTVQLILQGEKEAQVLTGAARDTLTALLEHLPSGILRRMPAMPDMPQTSLNMGVLCRKGEKMSMTFSVRSASNTEKQWLIQRMCDLTELLGGHCEISGVYPAWEYVPDSTVRTLMAETYEELTGRPAELVGIHAGVECGLISEKLPGIDCISYGPQMCDIHTTREALNIASVERTYALTLRVLEKLAG